MEGYLGEWVGRGLDMKQRRRTGRGQERILGRGLGRRLGWRLDIRLGKEAVYEAAQIGGWVLGKEAVYEAAQ